MVWFGLQKHASYVRVMLCTLAKLSMLDCFGCLTHPSTPNLVHLQTLLIFILLHLTSSFAPVIITIRTGCLLVQTTYTVVFQVRAVHNIYNIHTVTWVDTAPKNKILIKYIDCSANTCRCYDNTSQINCNSLLPCGVYLSSEVSSYAWTCQIWITDIK